MNPGFNSGSCPVSPNGYQYGWHLVLPDISHSFLTINCTFSKAGTVTDMVQEPCGMHAYVYTPTGDTLLGASANVSGSSNVFTLSDVCSPPSKSSFNSFSDWTQAHWMSEKREIVTQKMKLLMHDRNFRSFLIRKRINKRSKEYIVLVIVTEVVIATMNMFFPWSI